MLKFKLRNILPSHIYKENKALQCIKRSNYSFQIFKANNSIKKNNQNIDLYAGNENKDVQKHILRGKNRKEYSLKESDEVHGFKVIKIKNYPEFQIKGFFLQHKKTDAKYFHLDTEDLNNAFGIHLNTPPFDNTGVFHILEHLSLCGSAKYKIRDPFMNMLKRSLNTYMNAWTGPDFTMYPFATQNAKDFKNLSDVYLDAVYNPSLDYLDFLQEAWRHEFLDQATKKSGLIFKGVVFNEMKGDMGRQESYFLHKLQSNLFVKSSYNFNSGGDPRFIPELRYEDLVQTHKKFYHPSNSKFISYGDLNFLENLELLNDTVLGKYERNSERIFVPNSLRLEKPREVIDFYMPEMGVGDEDVSKFAIAYLCQDINEDVYETFKMSILSQLLMEGPNATMFRKLIESGLAPGYCHGYGYDTSIKEGTFTIGVQNIPTDYKHFRKIEEAIFEGLQEVAEKGFERKFIDEILHMVEYDSKRPRDDFAINLLNQSFGFLTHSDYPFTMLHVNEFCDKLRAELASGIPVFQGLVRKYLIENQHRLKLILKPKHDLLSDINKFESDLLLKRENELTPEDIEKINKDTQNLVEHQNKLQDFNILPTLTIEDIPRFVEMVPVEKLKLAFDIPLHFHNQPTNGISFLRLKANIKDLPSEFKEFLNFYCEVLPKLGTEHSPYQEFQNKLHTESSGLSVYIDAFSDIDNPQLTNESLVFEFSFLDSNTSTALKLLEELLSAPAFADFVNLNQIIKQESVRIANEINSNSLNYAMDYASAGISEPNSIYSEFKSDMKICAVGTDIMKLSSPKELLEDLAQKFFLMHNLILRKNNISLSLNGNKKYLESVSASCNFLLNAIKNANAVFIEELKEEKNKKAFEEKFFQTVIKTPAQVNDCVEAFKIPHYKSTEYPKCVILANLSELKYLHREIREMGGAYGAGATLSDSGLCSFYSFRDPNPKKTFLTFEKSIVKISEGKFDLQDIIDAKIYSFSVLDKIINPANKGLIGFLRGVSEEDRNEFRKRLLEVTKEDVIEVAKKIFIPQIVDNKTSRVVFGNPEFDAEENNEWEIVNSFDFLSESYFKADEEIIEERIEVRK